MKLNPVNRARLSRSGTFADDRTGVNWQIDYPLISEFKVYAGLVFGAAHDRVYWTTLEVAHEATNSSR